MRRSPVRFVGSILVVGAVLALAFIGAATGATGAIAQVDPSAAVAELYTAPDYTGAEVAVTDQTAGELTVDGIESLVLANGWDALLCTGADGSGTCRMYSDGRYPSLPGFGQPIRYACVHFRKTPGELGQCRSNGSQRVEHTLRSVPPLDDQQCSDRFPMELTVSEPVAAQSTQVYTSKVLALVHNPQVQQPGSDNVQDLYSWMGWPSMADRAACLTRFYDHVSNRRMQFEIVGITDIDMWPDNDMQKGWDYVSTDPNRPIEPDDKVDTQELGHLFVDKVFIDGRSVCDMVRSGDVDEIWIYNAGGFGYFESALVGPDAFFYNWPAIRGLDCGRTFRVAAESASRGVMVHNLMHGMESTLRAAQGVVDSGNPSQPWGLISGDSLVHLFMRSPKDVIEEVGNTLETVGCGNTHFTPSMQTRPIGDQWEHEYWYGDQAISGGSEPYGWSRLSNCAQIPSMSTRGVLDDELAAEVRQRAELVNCSEWNCTEWGFYEYWHEHWSQGIGCQVTSTEEQQGVSYDWWRYFADPLAVYEPCEPVALAGDPDCDGVRTSADAALIVRHRVEVVSARADCASGDGELSLAAADIDANGLIDIADALMIATCVDDPAAAVC